MLTVGNGLQVLLWEAQDLPSRSFRTALLFLVSQGFLDSEMLPSLLTCHRSHRWSRHLRAHRWQKSLRPHSTKHPPLDIQH